MATTMVKRAVAGAALAAGLMFVAPAVASADMLIYQGPSSNGAGHNYLNVNTNTVVYSHYYLGATFDTGPRCPVDSTLAE